MRDPFRSSGKKPLRQRLLGVDAALDAGLYAVSERLLRLYDALSDFMWHFRLRGFPRLVVELASPGFMLAFLGFCLVIYLATPAINMTRGDAWRHRDEIAVLFLDRYGVEMGRRGILHGSSIKMAGLPDYVTRAVLATEDRRFNEHFGIDFIGTARAMIANARAGGVVEGGSTLTQQAAKNLFLTPEKTITRKISEAFLALWLELNLSKDEILKLYLDRVYMGAGVFGLAAASQAYFGKAPEDLTLAEAAMLAGLFKAPTKYSPLVDMAAARGRARQVLANMVEAGYLTRGQVLDAMRNPAEVVSRESDDGPNYFMDWAFNEVRKSLGERKPDGILTVHTSYDPTLQKIATSSVVSHLRQYGKQYGAQDASMVVADTDGAVRAMVGGKNYGDSQFNRAVDAMRQPGSSFKPVVYTAAMLDGMTPNTILTDAPISIGRWSPQNYNRSYAGRIRMRDALRVSINTIPVRLTRSMGPKRVADVARRLGIRSPITENLTLALGASGVSVLDMTGVYATFANDGMKAGPYAFTRITADDGEVLYDRKRNHVPERIIPEKVARYMNSMLGSVISNGTGQRAQVEGVPAAGKTGTTSAYRDAWFCGYTGNYVAAVWFGNDNYVSMNRLTGGMLPAMAWQAFMQFAHASIDLRPVPGLDFSMRGNVATAGGSGEKTSIIDDETMRLASIRNTVPEKTADLLRALAQELEGGNGSNNSKMPDND